MSDQLNILVIDDDDVDRMALKRALRHAGFNAAIVEAASCKAALKELNAQHFDCLFIDYNLPDSTGLELLRNLSAGGFRTPVIIMTGQGDEQIAVELMKAGASDYIPKNALSAERLQSALPSVLRVFRTEQELRDTEERLRLAIESAAIGTWDFNPETQERKWSDRAKSFFGLTADAPLTDEVFRDRVHPEDRERVEAAVSSALDPAGNGNFDAHYRVVWDDGSVRWIRGTGRAFFRGSAESRRAVRFLGTLHDVTAEKEADAALRAALQTRDEVLAIVSHDLRNPLNTVLASASLMTDLPLTMEQQKQQIEIIKRTGHTMNRLLQDLLDVSRIEAGRLPIEEGVVNAASLVRETCTLFENQAKSKELHLVCEVREDTPAVIGDRERIAQVFANLISNAIKLTPQEGRITISAHHTDAHVVFEVADTGPGIPADELPHIFERFWQARRSQRTGAGLGLAIVKGIVEAHGGEIGVVSTPGVGTTFSFAIPAVPQPALSTAS